MALLTNNLKLFIHRMTAVNTLHLSSRLYAGESSEPALSDENKLDPSKDRSKVVPVETSIKYLQSKAYKQTYAENPVWFLYRRNHKGGLAPKKTRKSCVRNGVISTGNPCPICRDEYLVLHHLNTQLLEQFISEHTGQVLESFKTGLCRKKQKDLLLAIEKAWDEGLLTYDVPFREYDYSLYQNKTSI